MALGKRFWLDSARLTLFKDSHINIYIKENPNGNYDLQFVWKYYFPRKYVDLKDNEFYYQLLIDSASNAGLFLVYCKKEDNEVPYY